MIQVAVILVNYNSTRLTRKCLHSLQSIVGTDYHQNLIVWDNDSVEKPKFEDFPGVDFVFSKTNDGFARGYNRAVAYVNRKYHPDYLIILNNDTRVTKGMVSELIAVNKTFSGKCLVVPKIYFEQGHEFHKQSYTKNERGKVLWYAGGGIDWQNILPFHLGVDEVDRSQFDEQLSTAFVTGCCFCITPDAWRKLGGFDEKYFLYFEDLDLSIRALQKSLKLIYAPKAKLYHVNAGSTSGSGSNVQTYYQTRNRLRFGLQYGKSRAKLALLKEAWRFWRHGEPAQRLGVIDALEAKWGNQNKRLKQKLSASS